MWAPVRCRSLLGPSGWEDSALLPPLPHGTRRPAAMRNRLRGGVRRAVLETKRRIDMKIRYLVTLQLLFFLLCSCMCTAGPPTGRYTSDWSGGANTSMAWSILIIFMLVVGAIAIFGFYMAHAHSQRIHDRYDQELERLDRQFKEKQISEERYYFEKKELSRKYKWYNF